MVSAGSVPLPLAGKRYGKTEPRVWTRERRELTPETSLGFEAIEFAETVLGIELFPWQRWLLIHALELNEDGTFRFRKVVVLVARQQGKTTLFKVWALWRLFCDGAELVLGTAQDLSTAEKTWEQTYNLAKSVPDCRAELAQKSLVNGAKFFRLASGGEYAVKASTGGGGRGASAELVFMDELREHKDHKSWSAVTKTTNAIPRAQVVAMSNAGDATSEVLNGLQDRATAEILAGNSDTQTGLFEWSATPGCDIWDRDEWAQACPSLGYGTITEEIIASDCEADPEAVFRTEVLCQRVQVLEPSVFPENSWDGCEAADTVGGFASDCKPVVCVEVSHNRSMAYVVLAGRAPDGKTLVEVAAQRAGTDWVVPWLTDRVDLFERVTVQGKGAPASSLADPLRGTGLEVVEWGGAELSKAHGSFFDLVCQGNLWHLGQPILNAAADTAKIKPLGDAWVFDRAKSPNDVAPLVGCVAATWLLGQVPEAPRRSAYDDEDADLMIL
ncbi:terminase [Rhodococcus hoagii]|nr:terminase [Prescottella equi]